MFKKFLLYYFLFYTIVVTSYTLLIWFFTKYLDFYEVNEKYYLIWAPIALVFLLSYLIFRGKKIKPFGFKGKYIEKVDDVIAIFTAIGIVVAQFYARDINYKLIS